MTAPVPDGLRGLAHEAVYGLGDGREDLRYVADAVMFAVAAWRDGPTGDLGVLREHLDVAVRERRDWEVVGGFPMAHERAHGRAYALRHVLAALDPSTPPLEQLITDARERRS